MQPVIIDNGEVKFAHKSALALGIIQVIAGVACLAIGIALWAIFTEGHSNANSHNSIGVGILFVIAGGLTIGASARKNQCLIIASMVLSIFSFLASIAVITGPAIALALIASVCDFDEQDCALYDMAIKEANALFSGLVVLGCVEFIVAIWTTVICGMAVCCCRQRQSLVVQMETQAVGYPVVGQFAGMAVQQRFVYAQAPAAPIVLASPPPQYIVKQDGAP